MKLGIQGKYLFINGKSFKVAIWLHGLTRPCWYFWPMGGGSFDVGVGVVSISVVRYGED